MELIKENLKSEVGRFRKNFKSEAIDRAEKALTLEKRGNVGLIVFDTPDTKANTLGTPMMLRLFDLLTQVEEDKSIKALVTISRKPSIFIAGADISEIQGLADGNSESADALMKLQSVFTYMENLPIPTIAAIHGACMGGGTEFALACDYRMVSEHKSTRIALPEVMLGVIPGWGGTQRLPKLVGLEQSLGMILTGKNIDARKAVKMGLADQKVPPEWMESRVLEWAEELGAKGRKRSREYHKSSLEKIPGGKWIIFDQAKKQVLSKSKGNYPAPLKALEVIRRTYGGDLLEGLKAEANAFAELVVTPECTNLIRVFYLNEGVKKDRGVEGVKGSPVKAAGVIGAGVMGGGIAQLFAAKNVRVRMKDINWEAITKGYQTAFAIFHKKVKRRRMKPFERDNAMARIEGTVRMDGFRHLDLVVEAVVESMDIKKKVFQELEANVGDHTVLATNTSSLSVTELGAATRNPSRVVGMHFFNPVDKMPLVEVIRGEKTSDEAVATVFQFAKKLGKTPIVVKDAPGFVVNRILGPYLNETIHLLTEGVDPEYMDKVMLKFGMPMGPCTLTDEVGLDVAVKVSKVLFGAFGERMKPAGMMDTIEEGRLGKKSGKGIYIYSGKTKTVDTEWLKKMGAKPGSAKLTAEEITKRLIYPMINEAARCLEEDLVRKVSDIDVGMIFGTGFAPFRGGLLRYADTIGVDNIVSELDVLTREKGERFKPSDHLQKLAVGKQKFYQD